MRFFKKYDPRQQLLLGNGQWFTFHPTGDYGIVSTEDSFLISQFELSIKAQRGGVSEISHAEYEDLKKNPRSSKKFRPEKISPQLLRKLQGFKQGAGRVVDNIIDAGEEIFTNISSPLEPSNYRPGSVKRA